MIHTSPSRRARVSSATESDPWLAIAEHLAREVGDRFAPRSILREKVAAGHLGRKSGQGFYTW
jgi:3-hydroxybutyryl-CoA dehydrogenase